MKNTGSAKIVLILVALALLGAGVWVYLFRDKLVSNSPEVEVDELGEGKGGEKTQESEDATAPVFIAEIVFPKAGERVSFPLKVKYRTNSDFLRLGVGDEAQNSFGGFDVGDVASKSVIVGSVQGRNVYEGEVVIPYSYGLPYPSVPMDLVLRASTGGEGSAPPIVLSSIPLTIISFNN